MSVDYPNNIDNIDNPDDYELLIQDAAEEGAWPLVTPLLPGNFFQLEPLTPAQAERAAEEYIQRLEAWEQSLNDAERIPVHEYIGDPFVQPLSALDPARVAVELDKLLDLLAKHSIYVDFINEVSDEEAYRFLAEDLLNLPVANVRNDVMNIHFIYEEFYPGDEEWDEEWNEERDDEFGDINRSDGYFDGGFHPGGDWGDIPF